MDDQEVNTIRGQFQAGLWPQFLQMVQIDGLRGWSGQAVELNFPVVAAHPWGQTDLEFSPQGRKQGRS